MSQFIRYIDKKFNEEQRVIILQANTIVDEYTDQGYSLTLRQLYYQFVARGWTEHWPTGANTQKSYNRLGTIISDGRMAGLISWTAIEDRTRYLQGTNTFESIAQALMSARDRYAIDLWHNQEWRPEVWVEKEALAGVVGGICNQLRVNFFACRGYASQSALWEAGQRLHDYVMRGQRPIIFHLGDHDPSGLDMTRDNQERLSLFAGGQVQVVRLALNMDQVEQYDPPANPAKVTDSRAAAYMAEHGESSWELDALPPTVIADLIRDAVVRLRNPNLWDAALAEESEDRNRLDQIIEQQGD